MPAAKDQPSPTALCQSIEATDRLVAERMRRRRIMLGMTQQQLAKTVGTAYQQLHKYETGEDRISTGRLYRIAQALDLGIGYFFKPIEPELSPVSPIEQRRLQELARHVAALDSREREVICMIARAMAAG
jgi:transcriptional regulator with XRE-family HTH domain